MQPRNPTPRPRKVEVDLSEILIQSEAQSRAQKAAETGSATLPAFWRDSSVPSPSPRVSSAEWTNIIFAVGASFVAIFCTLATFDDLDQFRRNAYRHSSLYASPRFSANSSESFVGTTTRALRRQSHRARPGALPEKPALPAPQIPNSPSTLNRGRFLGDQNLLNHALTAARSLSSGPIASLPETASEGEGTGTTQPVKSVRSAGKMSARQTRALHGPTRKVLSSQARAGNSVSSRFHERDTDKSSSRTISQPARVQGGRLELGQSLTAMQRPKVANQSMHSIAGSLGGAHSMPATCMQMQHGMLAESGGIGALHGLNNAGLAGGAGHHRGGARR